MTHIYQVRPQWTESSPC